MFPSLLPPETGPPVDRRREARLALLAPGIATALTATGFGLYFADAAPAWVVVTVLTAAGAGFLAVIVTTCMGAVTRIPAVAVAFLVLLFLGQLTLAYTTERVVSAVRGVEAACVVVDRHDYTAARPRSADEAMTAHTLECDGWPPFREDTPRDAQLPREVTATFDPKGVADPVVGEVDWTGTLLFALAPAGLIAAAISLRWYVVRRV